MPMGAWELHIRRSPRLRRPRERLESGRIWSGWPQKSVSSEQFWLVVTGICLFSHILEIIIPIDSYFSEGLKPPTRIYWACLSWNFCMICFCLKILHHNSPWFRQECRKAMREIWGLQNLTTWNHKTWNNVKRCHGNHRWNLVCAMPQLKSPCSKSTCRSS